MSTSTPSPCVACVSAATALVDLSTCLRTAREALCAAEQCMKLITVPLPNDIAIELGYRPVDLAGIPEPFRNYCQKNDLHILQAQPAIVHSRVIDNYNTHASSEVTRDVPAVIPEANGPVMDWDARIFNSTLSRNETTGAHTVINPEDDLHSASSVISSVSSVSTDWEREYSIDPSTMIDLSNLMDQPESITGRVELGPNLGSPEPDLVPFHSASASDGPVHHSTDHVPPEERWYVIYAGKKPGVVQGHQNRLKNIEGMSKNDSHRVSSEAVGWKLFLKGLEDGRVLQVQRIQDAKRLTIADFE
ncbi:hypothetical protein H0H93_008175 [Arthromyces matolae]|nr:hypothetical protein H0H93_008175 [Arthromyces matolae]